MITYQQKHSQRNKEKLAGNREECMSDCRTNHKVHKVKYKNKFYLVKDKNYKY